MEIRFQILMVLSSLVLIAVVWQLIKRGHFRPAYALLWFLTSITFLVVSLFRSLVVDLANFFQVVYAPAFMFALGNLFILALLLNQTVLLSVFAKRNKELAQNYALLQWRLEHLEEQTNIYKLVVQEEDAVPKPVDIPVEAPMDVSEIMEGAYIETRSPANPFRESSSI